MSWLWSNGDYTLLNADSPEDVGRLLTDFEEEDRWVVIGQPRTGMILYRRATWWDRLRRRYRWLR